MADTLYNAFKNIADAIRLKTGSSATMTPDEMVSAIGNISADYTLDSLSIDANGTYTAESGHAYNSVSVTVPTDVVTESLIVTENGTYNADSGKAYGTITVNVPDQIGSGTDLAIIGLTEVQASAQENIQAGDTVYLTGLNWEDVTSNSGISEDLSTIYNETDIFNFVININGTRAFIRSTSKLLMYNTTTVPWTKSEIAPPNGKNYSAYTGICQVDNNGIVLLDDDSGLLFDLDSGETIDIYPNMFYPMEANVRSYTCCKRFNNYICSNQINSYFTAMRYDTVNDTLQGFDYDHSPHIQECGVDWISDTDYLLFSSTDDGYYNTVRKYRISSTVDSSTQRYVVYKSYLVWSKSIDGLHFNYDTEKPIVITANEKTFVTDSNKIYYLTNVNQDNVNSVSVTELDNYPDGFVPDGNITAFNISADYSKLIFVNQATNVVAILDTTTLKWNVVGYYDDNLIPGYYHMPFASDGNSLLICSGSVFKKGPKKAYLSNNEIHSSYALGYATTDVVSGQNATFKVLFQ